MKTYIFNATKFPDNKLRRIIKLAINAVSLECDAFCIDLKKSRTRIHGKAYLKDVRYKSGKFAKCGWHRHVTMWVTQDHFRDLSDERLKTFLQVFEHELDHTMGLDHGDMMSIKNKKVPHFTKVKKIVNEPEDIKKVEKKVIKKKPSKSKDVMVFFVGKCNGKKVLITPKIERIGKARKLIGNNKKVMISQETRGIGVSEVKPYEIVISQKDYDLAVPRFNKFSNRNQ